MKRFNKLVALVAFIGIALLTSCEYKGSVLAQEPDVPEEFQPKIDKKRSHIPSWALEDEEFKLFILIGDPEKFPEEFSGTLDSLKNEGHNTAWVTVNHAVEFVEVSIYELWYRDPIRDVLKWEQIYDISNAPKDKPSGFPVSGSFGDPALWDLRIVAWNSYVDKKHGDRFSRKIDVMATGAD